MAFKGVNEIQWVSQGEPIRGSRNQGSPDVVNSPFNRAAYDVWHNTNFIYNRIQELQSMFSDQNFVGQGLRSYPVGSVVLWGAQNGSYSPPSGWLVCDGTSYRVSDYLELYSVVTTIFRMQWDTSSLHFRVPDLRGRFVRGHDTSGMYDPSRNLGSHQSDEIKAHKHGFKGMQSNGVHKQGSHTYFSGGLVKTELTELTISPGEVAQETRPKNISLIYIIKY